MESGQVRTHNESVRRYNTKLKNIIKAIYISPSTLRTSKIWSLKRQCKTIINLKDLPIKQQYERLNSVGCKLITQWFNIQHIIRSKILKRNDEITIRYILLTFCIHALVKEARVQLVNGPNRRSGRVEIIIGTERGTVCDDNWDDNDAKVICKMLGYEWV